MPVIKGNSKTKVICFSIMALILFSMSGCKRKDNNIYIISKHDLIKQASYRTGSVKLMPPVIFLGTDNLIITDSGDCYFYSFREPVQFNIGVDGDSYEEPFSRILTSNIVSIPHGCEKEFIDKNIVNIKSKLHFKAISVSSFKDTITNNWILSLVHLSEDTSSHIILSIRVTIPKEKAMLKYKFQGT
jgi:hypothetical protein